MDKEKTEEELKKDKFESECIEFNSEVVKIISDRGVTPLVLIAVFTDLLLRIASIQEDPKKAIYQMCNAMKERIDV